MEIILVLNFLVVLMFLMIKLMMLTTLSYLFAHSNNFPSDKDVLNYWVICCIIVKKIMVLVV